VDRVVAVHSDDAVGEMRRLAREHGLLVGRARGQHGGRPAFARGTPRVVDGGDDLLRRGEKYLSEYFIPEVRPVDAASIMDA